MKPKIEAERRRTRCGVRGVSARSLSDIGAQSTEDKTHTLVKKMAPTFRARLFQAPLVKLGATARGLRSVFQQLSIGLSDTIDLLGDAKAVLTETLNHMLS